MRFVHSRCNLRVFLGGYVLDCRCDLRCLIELREFVLPWSILLHVLLDVLYQIAEAFPFVVACAFVMDITEGPLNRIARGQYVGNQSNAKRGWHANHCLTALAL
jgi:hypothetical protein